MKITKVYTRTGDQGETSLVGGIRIKKSDKRLEAYGTVDELNAHLGLLVSMLKDEDQERAFLLDIQNNLFIVCTHLAIDQSQTPLYPSGQLDPVEVERLEQAVDRIMGELPERQGFILPGGCQAACQAHVCRTVCRRAERRIAALAETATVGKEVIQFVNRLSDYLFVLAKKITFNNNTHEIIWQKVCR